MKDPIKKYFKVGTVLWMSFPDQDVIKSIKKIAADDFFDAVEVCGFSDENTREIAKELLLSSHLTICYGAHPMQLGTKLNPNDTDEDARKKAQQALLEAVDEAHGLGAKGIAFLSGKWEEKTKELAFSQLLKTTGNICAYAGEKNMTVELEIFDYDMDKKVLIGPAPYALEFAAEVKKTHDNFGLLVDLSHIPTTHETPDFVVRTLRQYITHFHIGNAVVKPGFPAYGDMHPRFGFPAGENDVPELLDFFRVLKSEGFFNAKDPLVLSFEVKPWKGEDPDIVLANSKRALNRAWALLED